MNLEELERDKKKLEELRKLEREGKYTLIEKELEELTEKYLKITTDNKEVLRFKADLLLVASIVALYQTDYKEARRLAEEAVEILKRTRDYHRLPFALSRLAETYRYGGDLVKAEKLDREAIKVIENNSQPEAEREKILPGFLRELGDVLIKEGKEKEAIAVLRKGLVLAKKNRDGFSVGHLTLTLIDLFIGTEKLEEAEEALEYAKAFLKGQRLDLSIQTEISILVKEAVISYLKGIQILTKAEQTAQRYDFKYLLSKIKTIKEELRNLKRVN